jgi:predicted component of type VI protein secretion system
VLLKRKALEVLADVMANANREEDRVSTKKAESPAKVSVNFEKSLRVSQKLLDLLKKKTKTSAEAYLAVRLVAIFLEEKLGLKLTPDQEEELRELLRKDKEASKKPLT